MSIEIEFHDFSQSRWKYLRQQHQMLWFSNKVKQNKFLISYSVDFACFKNFINEAMGSNKDWVLQWIAGGFEFLLKGKLKWFVSLTFWEMNTTIHVWLMYFSLSIISTKHTNKRSNLKKISQCLNWVFKLQIKGIK